MQHLMRYGWPGNIRELKNAIEHAFVTVSGDCLTLLDLPSEVRNPGAGGTTSSPSPLLHSTLSDNAERERIEEALRKTHGHKMEAAKILGMSRVTLWKKINRLRIETPH